MPPDASVQPTNREGQRGRWSARAPWLLSLAVLLFYSPVVFLGRAFFLKDTQRVVYPTRLLLRQRLLALDLPEWLPNLDMGMPFLANPSNGVVYPLNLLLLLPAPYCVGLFIVVHEVIAIWGSWLLLRALRTSAPAAALGALSFALGGYMVSLTWVAQYMMSLSWLPLVAWLGLRMVRHGSLADAALMSIAWAFQVLSGEPQAVLLTTCFVLTLVLAEPGLRSSWPRRLWLLAAALALMAALAAPQILSALELIPRSRRATGIDLTEASHWSMHPLRLLELVAPWLFGSPLRIQEFLGYFMDDEGSALHRDPWVVTPYFGSLCLLLSLFAVARPPRRHRAWVRALGGLALLTLLIALGRHTPVFGWYFQVFPVARLFRYPAKYFGLVAAIVPFVAAAGVDAALSRPWRTRLPLCALGLGLLLAAGCLLTPWVAEPLRSHRPDLTLPAIQRTQVTALLVEAATLVLIAVTLTWLRRRPAPWALGLLALASAQTLRSTWIAYETVSTRAYEEPPLARRLSSATPPGEPSRLMHAVDSLAIAGLDAAPAQVQADAFNAVLLKDIGLAYGLGYADSYISSEEGVKFEFWRTIGGYRRHMLDVFGVRHVVLPEATQLPAETRLERLRDTGPIGAAVFENRSALPFAFATGALVPAVGTSGVLEALRAPGVARGLFAIVERSTEVPSTLGEPGRVGDCQVQAPLTDRIELECRLSRPGFVVVNASHHPNFTAQVDGKPVPLVAANAFVMATAVGAGRHHVALEYSESSLAPASLVSALALGVCILLLVRAKRATAARGRVSAT